MKELLCKGDPLPSPDPDVRRMFCDKHFVEQFLQMKPGQRWCHKRDGYAIISQESGALRLVVPKAVFVRSGFRKIASGAKGRESR